LNHPSDLKNLARAAAAPRCQFYLSEGRRCASPALRNQRLCRIHQRALREAQALRRRKAIPNPAAARTIAVGITEVMRYLWDERPSLGQCGKLLYGMQLASSSLDKMKQKK
jgi:hypothetical protein